MAIKRPTPKVLSPEAQNAITNASAQQTGKAARIKSYDVDFPVYEVPINGKNLIYIPNHVVENPDGTIGLRMDKFAAHPVLDGRSFMDIRCSQGVIVDDLGLDGSCPLCDGMQECWQLYNLEMDDIARSRGIDRQSPESKELLKNDSITALNARVIKEAEVWYTFPIVVIDCEEKDGQMTTIPKRNAQGQISGKPMWYCIRERTYLEKWNAGFDSLEDTENGIPDHPAGLWAILNFTYTPKSGNHDKMGSAKSLKVTFKTMQGYEQWATYFDQLTNDWTPAKAQEVVVLDAVRDKNEMVEVADSLLKGTRDKLAIYNLSKTNGSAPAVGAAPVAGALPQNAEATLAGFGATPVAPATPASPAVPETPAAHANLTGEMPNVGVQ